MSIKKTALKQNKCKVNFSISSVDGNEFENASLVGDFNNWDAEADKMKKLKKDGSFSLQKTFDGEKEYQFKYLLDGKVWMNELEADKQVPSGYVGYKNSVISL
jgi:1,4-alpha-glucan branching enzyme